MPEKNVAYYLTLFKIEGHETWRAHLTGFENGFEESLKVAKPPKVVEKRVHIIDRLSGLITDEISEEK